MYYKRSLISIYKP